MQQLLTLAPIPGVDESCNAMYLSLVGEMPEQYCPPGCTLQANARGAIFVIDHIRRIGYPLQLTAPPAAVPAIISAAVVPDAATPAPVLQPPGMSLPSPRVPAPPLSDLAADATQVVADVLPYMLDLAEADGVAAFVQPPLAADPTMAELQAPPPRAPTHKRSRANSPPSQLAPLSHSHSNHRQDSQEASTDPTAPGDEYALTPSSRSIASVPTQGWTGVEDERGVVGTTAAEIARDPRFCLIIPRRRWLEDIFFTLQMSHRWPPGNGLLFYCHYCRVYFSTNPHSMHRHLSSATPHKVQRQRVRGYLVSKVGRQLLDTSLKRRFRVLTLDELHSVPDRLFPEVSRLLLSTGMAALRDFIEPRSLMTASQRDRVVRDGAPLAEASPDNDDLTPFTTGNLNDEPPEVVGWRFVMHGLDVVKPYCKTCDVPLCWKDMLKHDRDPEHSNRKERYAGYPNHKRAKDDR